MERIVSDEAWVEHSSQSCVHYLNTAYTVATFGLFDHNCPFFVRHDQTDYLSCDVNLSQILQRKYFACPC